MTKVNVEVFTDFDGTLSLHGKTIHCLICNHKKRWLLISLKDTGLLLIDDHRSLGPEKRRQLEHDILDETITYR
jgi:2-hydroxy-3-keto-5-methylthiopentenyl-1-phosphate phosphatase